MTLSTRSTFYFKRVPASRKVGTAPEGFTFALAPDHLDAAGCAGWRVVVALESCFE